MKRLLPLILYFLFPIILLGEIDGSSFYHYLKGLTHFYDSDLASSERELLKALEFEQNSYVFSYLSEIYLHKLDFEKAEKMAETALKMDPSNINALLILGNIYLSYIREGKNGEYLKKAEEVYKKVITIAPNFPDAYYILGKWIYMPSSRWKEAEDVLKKYSEISLYREEAFILLGEIAQRAGDNEKAEDYYKKAISANPSSFIAYSYLCDFYKERNEISREIEACKIAIEKFPKSYVFHQRLAEALVEKNELKEALDIVNRGLEISSLNPQLLLTKAKILLNLKKYEEFFKIIEEVLNIDPNIFEAKIYLLEGYMQIYEYKRAAEVLIELEKEKNPVIHRKEIYKTLGYLYTLMKDYKSARFYLEKGLEMGKNDKDIYSYLSYVYKESGENILALRMAEEGLKLSPSQKSLILNKIYALAAIGETEQSFALIEEEFKKTKDEDFLSAALSIFIEKKDWRKGEEYIKKTLKKAPWSKELYLRIGDFYEKMGNFKKAEKALEKAISLNPSFGNALNYLAYSWAVRNKNLKKALALARRALLIDPENPDYLDTMGWVYFKLGQIEEAKKFLEKSFSKKPWEPEILEHIGFLRIKEGKIEEGITMLEKSIEIGSERKEYLEKFIRDMKKKTEGSSQKRE